MTAAVLSGQAGATIRREQANRALVRGWLYFSLLVLLALVLVGGATRLTNSGLSITEWKPIHGVIPPLSQAEWQEEFNLYKQIPQYAQMNEGMTLSGFKTIYWWEWTHRLIARSIGVVFALPLLFFWLTGRLEKSLKPKLLGILALGAFQGAIGWWMVASGLVYRTEVSQYRLATHLTIASIIFAAITYVARGLAPHSEKPASRGLQKAARPARFPRPLPDLSRRPRRRPARRAFLQHLAADGRRDRAARALRHRAGLAQLLRESEDGAVHPPPRRLYHLRRRLAPCDRRLPSARAVRRTAAAPCSSP